MKYVKSLHPNVFTSRLLLGLAALLYPMFSICYKALDPGVYDPIEQRLLFSFIAVTIIMGSFMSKKIMVKLHFHMITLASLVAGHFLFLAYQNDFTEYYVIGLLVIVAAIGFLYFTLSQLLFYLSAMLAGTAVLLYLAGVELSYFLLVILSIFTISVAAFVVFRARYQIFKQLQSSRQAIRNKNKKLNQINKEITDSIVYARKIQHAVLPRQKLKSTAVADYFIFYRPQAIVSGDFYWYHKLEGKVCIAVADCTGHGVPGAFMSIIGSSLLNEAVVEKDVTDPSKVLQLLDQGIQKVLKQGDTEKVGEEGTGDLKLKDGMDISFAVIDEEKGKLYYSGAYRPLYILRKGKLTKKDGTRYPIGGYYEEEKEFIKETIDLESGDTFYMLSDGYVDQFGGEKGKKFLRKRLEKLLLSIEKLPMENQKEQIEGRMNRWMNGHEQIDDMLVMGIKIK